MKKLITSFLMFTTFATVTAQTNVVFYTTEGDFMVLINDDLAPITGGNFLDLVNTKYYDGIIFHRVVKNFIIQGGDPTGTGSGGPGYSIPDEFAPSLSNIKKTISMANSGPNTGGSQFFFNMVNNTFLDHDKDPLASAHPVFGIVTENFHVVETISKVAVNGSNRPLTKVVIDSIRVTDILLTGITTHSTEDFKIKVYPNPVNANSVISITSIAAASTEIQLYDTFGKMIAVQNIEILHGENLFSIYGILNENLARGIYHLRIVIGQDTENIRISVQ